MKIDAKFAEEVLIVESDKSQNEPASSIWVKRFQHFSETCENTSKTHIAFLGTALLAKAVNTEVDVFSVKSGDDSEGAYSARGLAHNVLVPNAPKLDINLGVTGREPLNNQPYFRIKRVTKDIPVRGNSQKAIDELIALLEQVQKIRSANTARSALRAFIKVRKKYSPKYNDIGNEIANISKICLASKIDEFVKQDSEGGKRAQAVVAGMLDLFAGIDMVTSGRINDPDRHLPGDVGIQYNEENDMWEKVFEVRDKNVSINDIYIFVQKAIENKVKEAAIISVSVDQNPLSIEEVTNWAIQRGVSITHFNGWGEFISQVSFWSKEPQIILLQQAPQSIYKRLIEIEASENSVNNWVALFRKNGECQFEN